MTKSKVVYNGNGTFNRVRIYDDIFDDNKGKSISKTIKEYIETNIGKIYTIIESGNKVYLGEDLPGEFAYSKSIKSLSTIDKLAKGRASCGLKEIVEHAKNRKWSSNTKKKHIIDARYGFYRYDTTFSFYHNNKEKIYDGTILIRNDTNGKKYLYDIVNIKKHKKKIANLPTATSNSNRI